MIRHTLDIGDFMNPPLLEQDAIGLFLCDHPFHLCIQTQQLRKRRNSFGRDATASEDEPVYNLY